MSGDFLGLSGKSYQSAAARDHFDEQELKRLDAINRENPLDNMSAEEIAAAFAKMTMTQDQHLDDIRQTRAAEEFVAMHPEYVPHKRNAAQIQAALDYSGIKGTTVDELEAAYEDLRGRGLVEVDETRTAPPDQRRDNSGRFAAEPKLSLEEAYSMPMDELEARANREAYRDALIASQKERHIPANPIRNRTASGTSGRSSSGMSGRDSTAAGSAASRSVGMREEDLYNMSYEELEARARGQK